MISNLLYSPLQLLVDHVLLNAAHRADPAHHQMHDPRLVRKCRRDLQALLHGKPLLSGRVQEI